MPVVPIEGRILFNVEHENTPSQPAYIDSTGTHLIPVVSDTTLAHTIWASATTILFDSERSGPRHIYRMAVDGSAVHEITGPAQWQDTAAMSPDGRTIAYGTADAGSGRDTGIHVAHSDGGQPRPLTPGQIPGSTVATGEDGATFSPDGRWIAYIHIADAATGAAGLWIIHPDGTGKRQLTSDSTQASYPRWSPDGMTILFSEHEDDPTPTPQVASIWTIYATSGTPRPVTPSAADCAASEGDWSPNGNQIVYRYYCQGWDHNELRIADANGTHMQTLWVSPHARTAETPDWSS